MLPPTPRAGRAARSTPPPRRRVARPPRSAPSSPPSTSSCGRMPARRAGRRRWPTRCAPSRATSSRCPPRSGRDGGAALVPAGDASAPGAFPSAGSPAPAEGAEPLLEHVDTYEAAAAGSSGSAGGSSGAAVRSSGSAGGSSGAAASLARGLLADVWVVESFDGLRPDFHGVAVTRSGRVWSPATRELRQVPAGGEDRLLAERNRRDELVAASERAAQAEHAALAEAEKASQAVAAADAARDEADRAARDATRARDEAGEAVRHTGWLIEQRRRAPDEGPTATRRAQLGAALAAERRLAERAERERRLALEHERLAADDRLAPAAARVVAVLEVAGMAVGERQEVLQAELDA